MKKILLAAVVFSLAAVNTYAQDKDQGKNADAPAQDTVLPYKQNPTLPAFNILMMDSVTIFNTYNIPKGKKTALFFFSPDCSHCMKTMGRIIDSMDMLSDLQFYLITPVHNMDEIRKFRKKHHLDKYKNVVLTGRDYEFFFGSFYKVRFVPDVALYDENKKLIKLIEGETGAQAIYDAIH